MHFGAEDRTLIFKSLRGYRITRVDVNKIISIKKANSANYNATRILFTS